MGGIGKVGWALLASSVHLLVEVPIINVLYPCWSTTRVSIRLSKWDDLVNIQYTLAKRAPSVKIEA